MEGMSKPPRTQVLRRLEDDAEFRAFVQKTLVSILEHDSPGVRADELKCALAPCLPQDFRNSTAEAYHDKNVKSILYAFLDVVSDGVNLSSTPIIMEAMQKAGFVLFSGFLLNEQYDMSEARLINALGRHDPHPEEE